MLIKGQPNTSQLLVSALKQLELVKHIFKIINIVQLIHIIYLLNLRRWALKVANMSVNNEWVVILSIWGQLFIRMYHQFFYGQNPR